MAKDKIAALVKGDAYTRGKVYDTQPEKKYHNTVPIVSKNNEWAVGPRPTYDSWSDRSASGVEGRGITAAHGFVVVVTNEDILGIVISTGALSFTTPIDGSATYSFNSNYKAAFCDYLPSSGNLFGVYIQNPGNDTSTNQGGTLWRMDTATPTEITSANCPGERSGTVMIRGIVQLNGYIYTAITNGNIFNSDLDDGATWSASNFIVAERDNGVGVYLGKHRDHIAHFSSKGIEFFYDAGLTNGSPLQRRQDIYHSIGAWHPNAFVEVGDIIYFIGRKPGEQLRLYKLENFQVSPVSTFFIDNKITNSIAGNTLGLDPLTDSYPLGDHSDPELAIIYTKDHGNLILLHLDETYALHLQTGTWHEWVCGADPALGGRYANWTNHYPIIDSLENGTVLFTNAQVAKEAGSGGDLDDLGLTTAESYFFTEPWDMDTNERKRISNLRILKDAQADSTYDPSNITVSWVDTDDSTAVGLTSADFPTGRDVNVATAKASIYRLGKTRQRIFKFEFDPKAFKNQSMKGIELEYDLLRG